MKIGYLHLGSINHGVYRYGKLLAKEAKKIPEIEVIEYEILLTTDSEENKTTFKDTAVKISQSGVNILHLQCTRFNKDLWGFGIDQYQNLLMFISHCKIPIVVTIHDIDLVKTISFDSKLLITFLKLFDNKLTHLFFVNQNHIFNKLLSFLNKDGIFRELFLIAIIKNAHKIFIFSDIQKEILQEKYNHQKDNIFVIPHFIENRDVSLSKEEARATLGFQSSDIILTLQGFIYESKGHKLLLAALPNLSSNTKVVFAGSKAIGEEDKYLNRLIFLAKKYGVDKQLLITGYLSEKELEMYLMATDIAICPFQNHSASGSLSTWISVGCPIIASDIPLIEEYNRIEPNVIEIFKPYDKDALSKTINKCLENKSFFTEKQNKLKKLQQLLNISVIIREHVNHYNILPSNKSPKM